VSDDVILGAVIFTLFCLALVLLSGAIIRGLRERAYQRDLERAYADEWCRTHRAHQHDDRHTHEQPGRPE